MPERPRPPARPAPHPPAGVHAPPPRSKTLRIGVLVAFLWLTVAALAPVAYPLFAHGQPQARVAEIQAVIGPPGRSDVVYPASLEAVRQLVQSQNPDYRWPDSPYYGLTYDPRSGQVSYQLRDGLYLREHVTMLVFQRLQELLIGVVILIVAAGVGQRVLRWIGMGGLFLAGRLLFGTALGLGAMALLTLGLGVVGLLTFWPFAGLFIVLGLAGGGPLVDDFRELRRLWREGTVHIGLWSGLMAAAGIFFVALPLLGAFSPPVDYDTLEYHLAAPAEYYRNGFIGRLEGNAYSNFPFNVEMLYLMSMVLRGQETQIGGIGSQIRGVYLARLMNVLLAALTGLSIWAFGRRFGGKSGARAGGIGCLLFLSCPWVFWMLTSQTVYVELGQALFSFLAVYAALVYAHGGRGREAESGAGRGSRGALILTGLFIGLALGTKYLAAPLLAVPLVAWLAVGEFRRTGRRLAEGLGRVALLVGVSGAVFSPWMAKNLVLTGNPTYPLLYSVFGGREWSDEQDAKWRYAHSPKFDQAVREAREAGRSPAVEILLRRPLRRLLEFVFVDLTFAAPVLLFVPFAFREGPTRRTAVALAAFLLYSLVVWYFFTHQVDRMLFYAFPVMAALAGWGYAAAQAWRPARWPARLVLAGYLIYLAILGVTAYFRRGALGDVVFERLGTDPLEVLNEALRRQGASLELPVEGLQYLRRNVNLTAEKRLLLLGEAETFYLSFYGAGHFVRSTVFDRQPFGEMRKEAGADAPGADPAADRAFVRHLAERRIAYVLVNYSAIQRFYRTYAFPFNGERRPGFPMTAEAIAVVLRRLERERLLRRVYPEAPESAAVAPCEIYEVIREGAQAP